MGMYEKFDYDSTSNIIQLDEIVLEYGPGDTLQRQGDTQYLYDANGRLIKKIEDCDSAEPKVWLYEWDAEDQLRSVTTPTGEVWEYKYDALGRRIVKQGPEKTVRFVYNGDVIVHEVENEIVNSSWVFDPHSFSPLCKVQNDQLYAVICDHLGTPRELVDGEGKIVWSVSYSAWGKINHSMSQLVDCSIRFQGQFFDEETTLSYNRYRYYNSMGGQFISQDPIGLGGGINNYQYAPNPINWFDPFGLIIVYRNLRPDENPANGLVAKKPGRNMTVDGHIRTGTRHNGSQFISTTTDPDVAAKWREPGQITVKFDTDHVVPDKLGNLKIVDVSTTEKAKAAGVKGLAVRNANASKEILIEGKVPAEAIEKVHGKKNNNCG
jgi:RHS repeat-associated protein